MSSGYDPRRSQVKEEALSNFIMSTITGDLREVPGIGPVAQSKLEAVGISTTFGLIGQFLLLKEKDVCPVEHCDRFWFWLNDVGINSNRAGIIKCIAEKVDTMFPGIYDGTKYE